MSAVRSADSVIDSSGVHVLLANLGFLLVPGPPLDHGAAYLLVAIRPKPTLDHFDPECIEYWAVADGRTEPAEVVWPMPATDGQFSWGPIRITDRVGAANTFVSFGGSLSVSRDAGVHAALFRSDAPILSLGGHSGPRDPLSIQVASFMARLRAAAGYDSPVRELAESLEPVALYAAFVAHAIEVYRNPNAAENVSPHLVSLLRSERHRLEADSLAVLQAGNKLADLVRAAS